MKFKQYFIIKLESLVSADVELIEALNILINIFKDSEKQKIFKIKKLLESGNSLVRSFSELSTDKELKMFMKIAEKSGNLKEVLKILKEKYEFEDNLKKETLNILIYPIMILLLSVIILLVMLIFVVPQFVEIYKEMNTELPKITKIVIYLSELIFNEYIYIIFFLISIIFLLLLIKKKFKEEIDKYVLYIPYFKNKYLLEFSQNIYILLLSGLDLVEALNYNVDIDNTYLRREYKKISVKLSKGVNIHKTFYSCPIFNEEYVSFIEIGERTGNLKKNFEYLKKIYMEKITVESKMFIKIIEPLSIILIAFFISIIIFSIMLPIFKMGDNII